jgi:hypothetical protein
MSGPPRGPARDVAATGRRVTLAWIVLATGLGGPALGDRGRGADAGGAVEGRAPPGEPVDGRPARDRAARHPARGVLGQAPPQALFATCSAGLLFFFLLEKAELYRHSHHHEATSTITITASTASRPAAAAGA